VTLEFVKELSSLVSSGGVEKLHHLTARGSNIIVHLNVSQEVISYTL
jgi:hypothetical protein